MWIELRWFIQTGGDTVVISPNGDGFQLLNSVDCFYRTWAISNDVSTAEHRVVTGLFSTLDAGFKRFQVGVDVTEDEIAHGV